MGVRGSENKKQKETTETNNQKDKRNDKFKNNWRKKKPRKTRFAKCTKRKGNTE